MEEILDEALHSLDDIVLTSSGGRNELEMRGKTGRSQSCGASVRRSEHCSGSCFLPTKENALKMLYCAAGSSKMYLRREKFRPSPYETGKRKPLNSLINPGFGFAPGRSGTRRVRSSDSYSDSRDESPNFFDPEEFQRQYSQLQGLSNSSSRSSSCKTDRFPVPILSRSKSLEDLRDSPNKSKSGRSKQVRFQAVQYNGSLEDNSNGATSSNSNSNSLGSPLLSVSPRTSFLNVLKGEASIKNEIDSMSMLIEKLDVA